MAAKMKQLQEESPCWKEGKTIFLNSVQSGPKPPTKVMIDSFFDDYTDLGRTIANCESLQAKADSQYHVNRGGRFVKKLLDSLIMVKSIADPFLEFAPESVSIAWCAISGLITIAASDIDNCEAISEACNNIVSVILTCRIYETRYTRVDEEARTKISGDSEIEVRIIQKIPAIVALIFDFAWYIRHHLSQNKIKRTFKETFSPKLKDKVQAIDDEYQRLRSIANDAFHERVLDSFEDIYQGKSLKKKEPEYKETGNKCERFCFLQYMHIIDEPTEISEKLNEINVVKGAISSMQLRQELEKKRRVLRPDETHIRAFRSIFDPVSNNSEVLCQWLLNDANYLNWEGIGGQHSDLPVAASELHHEMKPVHNIFYLRGKPGVGKSVAIACVLHRLTQKSQTPVCYFFFRQGDSATQTSIRALESLAAQLFDERWTDSEVELKQLIGLISTVERSREEGSPDGEVDQEYALKLIFDPKSVTSLIRKTISTLKKPTYIILDALDECIDLESQGLVSLLLEIARESDRVRIMVSSRDITGIEKTLCETSSVAGNNSLQTKEAIVMDITEERTSQDMDLFLGQSLKKIMSRRTFSSRSLSSGATGAGPQKSEDETGIISIIKLKANGMFTYAAMVIASLEQPSPLTLSQKLRSLPEGMDALYRRRLDAMGLEEKKLITLALKWVVWATKEISAIVIAENFKDTYGKPDSNEDSIHFAFNAHTFHSSEIISGPMGVGIHDPEIAETIYHLRTVGRDFLSIDGETYSIDVVHKSVRDWVVNEAKKKINQEYQLKEVTPTAISDEHGGIRLSIHLPVHVLSDSRFQKQHLPYKGASYWQSAAREPKAFALRIQSGAKDQRYEVYTLIENLKRLQSLWPKLDRKGYKWGLFWLKLREFARLENYRRWHIQYTQFELNLSEQDSYNPKMYQGFLHVAAKHSIPMVVEYLLANELATIDDLDGSGSTAFLVSAVTPELWQIFLRYQSDISIGKEASGPGEAIIQKTWRCLWIDCDSPDQDVVKGLINCCLLLIPVMKNINEPLGRTLLDNRPIHLAALTKSWELFEALMSRSDIDVRVTDSGGNSALHTSLMWVLPGTEETLSKIITALIDAGLDPNKENLDGATPLTCAISYQIEDAVKLLIDKGANCLGKSKGGYTAIHWAAARMLNIAQEIDNDVALSIFKLILRYDENFERETSEGTTPLDLAFESRNWDFVKAILTEYERKYGNDRWYLMRRDSYNRNFLHHCALNLRWGSLICKNILPMMEATQIRELLSDMSCFESRKDSNLPGLSSKAKDAAGTPLYDAIQEGNVELMEIYLKAGADVTIKSIVGLNCFEEAVIGLYRASTSGRAFGDEHFETKDDKINRYEKCCSILIDTSEELVAASSPACLHYLIARGSKSLVQKLIKLGINHSYQDDYGWTVVEWARAFRQEGILKLVGEGIKAKDGNVSFGSSPNNIQSSRKLTNQRHGRGKSCMKILDDGFMFETPSDQEIVEDGLQIGKNAKPMAVFDEPAPPVSGIFYFEVELLVATENNATIFLGFVGEFHRIDRPPGVTNQGGDDAYSACGMDGELYSTFEGVDKTRLRSSKLTGAFTFGKGDTIGCGIDVSQGLIFYTLNGEYAGVAFENVHGRWYGCISAAEHCKGKVNLGQKPFVFEEMNELLGLRDKKL
ncbi:hypothetical protein TWF694_003610 [Orbilia ellipsospora]|uniref:B30.2/SPRY domain-containing protein n=1 Tax=Orbilia ellipsospora TaxID=2528407 RepID=A0AAV9WZK1_9PEZI